MTRAAARRRLLVAAIPALVVVSLTALAGPGAEPGHAAGKPKPPAIGAPSAILIEASTGQVVFARKANDRRPIASTTKLMTALLALEQGDLEKRLTAPPYSAATAESRINLSAGERLTLRDLLRALMLASANDAAATIAVGLEGSRAAFVASMNRRAEDLGLRDTHYANPIGLDAADNYSTAADLVRLAARLRMDPFFRTLVDEPSAKLTSGNRTRTIENRNDLLEVEPAVDGVKTGFTSDAGYVLVGSATRNGVSVISAVLGAQSESGRNADTLALLRYGLGQFNVRRLVNAKTQLEAATVRYRPKDTVGLVARRSLSRIVRRGEPAQVVVDAPEELEGPLPAGAPVGTVTVRLKGKVIDRIPLVTASRVPEVGLGERTVSFLTKGSTLAIIGLAGVILVLLLSLSMRARRRRKGLVRA